MSEPNIWRRAKLSLDQLKSRTVCVKSKNHSRNRKRNSCEDRLTEVLAEISQTCGTRYLYSQRYSTIMIKHSHLSLDLYCRYGSRVKTRSSTKSTGVLQFAAAIVRSCRIGPRWW